MNYIVFSYLFMLGIVLNDVRCEGRMAASIIVLIFAPITMPVFIGRKFAKE